MRPLLAHLCFGIAVCSSLVVICSTQITLSSGDYHSFFKIPATIAGVQLLAAILSWSVFDVRPRWHLIAASVLSLLFMLEMTLRVWFRVRLM